VGEPRIRRARPEEIERVRAAYCAWGYGGGANPPDTVLIAERGGELVGIVRRTLEHDVVMLRGMCVAPRERRQGIGNRLLDAFAERLGGEECWCVPYSHLVGFYGRVGFEVVAADAGPAFLAERIESYRGEGLDVTLMRRPRAT
jgi:N-acetylglutamate synthase-like GNAT family acetyltransferase